MFLFGPIKRLKDAVYPSDSCATLTFMVGENVHKTVSCKQSVCMCWGGRGPGGAGGVGCEALWSQGEVFLVSRTRGVRLQRERLC